MKTLDEVIDALVFCSKGLCEYCPFQDEDRHLCKDAKCITAEHYLKEYRKKKDELDDILSDYVVLKEYWTNQQENPPLIWDELKQIEGKPVWINGVWYLITHTEDAYRDINPLINAIKANGVRCTFFPEDCNVIWQAYRKERE